MSKTQRSFYSEELPCKDVIKPWGSEHISDFLILPDINKEMKTKILCIIPGYRTSLQSHSHRTEYMVVLQGDGHLVTMKKEGNIIKEITANVKEISEGDQIEVPQGQTHRLENTGDIDLILVEIQVGKECNDDDIIRYEDDYGRVEEDFDEEALTNDMEENPKKDQGL